jgi:hypothetical protein
MLSRTPSPVHEYNDYASPSKFRVISNTQDGHREKGGLGALDPLPLELRQEIYALAFGLDE